MRNFLSSYGWPIIVGLLCAFIIIERYPEWVGLSRENIKIKQAPFPSKTTVGSSGPATYAVAVNNASPAVANLYTAKTTDNIANTGVLETNDLKHYFGESLPQHRIESSLGSAVIMSDQGYLLTNHHVIKGAEKLIVALKDGRELVAEVIGVDVETDLAVLKVDASFLPSITIGYSDMTQTGDVVLAIGNPYGVGQTVTMGIISATGRHHLGLNTYEDFLQTDAAINPGNSGGALVDARGNLIGINTAIFSRNTGSQGIGFAIPVKLALEVMESIIEHGKVVRGWLGLEVHALPEEIADSMQIKDKRGILVAGVYKTGPAAKAGLEAGDIILSIDEQEAVDGRASMNQVARMRPGRKIKIEVLQKGEHRLLTAELGIRPLVKEQKVVDDTQNKQPKSAP